MRFYKHAYQNPCTCVLESDIDYSNHQHEQVELCYVSSGQVQYDVGINHYTLTPGSLLLLFPYIPHTLTCKNDAERTHALLFLLDIDFVPDFERRFCEYMMPIYAFRPKELDAGTKHALRWLEMSAHNPEEYSLPMIRGWLTVVLGDLFYKHDVQIRKEPLNALLIQNLISYIKQHLSEELSIEQLCTHLGISTHYLIHTLKYQIYVNYHTLLTSIRLNHAEDLLCNSNLRLIDIALECGFRNIQNFTRNYKKMTGLTPSAFRKTYNEKAPT